MASSEELSYAFLESHPADSARVLERLAPFSAAALLQSAPLRLASPVLRQMLPLAGARCLELLGDDETAGLLRGVGAQAGVAILRHFDAGRRNSLLEQLPAALAVAFGLLLGHPQGTVGACMDPHALAFPEDMTCGEALERVRSASEEHVADPFVIDQSQHLLGYVELADLLRATGSAPLGRVARTISHRLPAQSMLAGLPDHPGWHESSTLPVVDREDRLIGAISHAAMQRALSIDQAKPMRPVPQGALVDIAGVYWFGVSAMIQSVISMLPIQCGENEI